MTKVEDMKFADETGYIKIGKKLVKVNYLPCGCSMELSYTCSQHRNYEVVKK